MRRLPARAEYLILAAIVVVQAAVAWHFASQSFFFEDDFVNFREAARDGLTYSYLTKPVYIHFAPAHRLADYLVQRYATLDFDVALAAMLGFYAASIVLMQRILALLFGAVWWTLALTFAFGLSIIFVGSLLWWAGGIHTLPTLALSLAAIWAYLHWRAEGGWVWGAVSVLAVTLGLLFYIKPLLVPVYLFLMEILLLARRPGVAAVRQTLRRGRWIWIGFAGVMGAYLVVYYAGGYGKGQRALPDLATLRDLLVLLWLKVVTPALLGVRVPPGPTSRADWVWIVAAQAVLIGALVVSVWRRPRAWRAWLFLGIGFLLNSIATAPRAAVFGTDIAFLLRYLPELAYLVPLTLAFAFASARGPAARRTEATATGGLALPRPAVAAVVAAALAAYCVLVWIGDTNLLHESSGPKARTYVENLRAALRQTRKAGIRPVLVNYPGPYYIHDEHPASQPYRIVRLFDRGVRFDRPAQHTYAVRADGTLEAVRFRRASGGNLQLLLAQGSATVTRASGRPRSGATCLTAGPRSALVQYRPRPRLVGPPWFLRVVFRRAAERRVPVLIDRGYLGYPPRPDTRLSTPDRAGVSLISLQPLPGQVPTIVRVALVLPPRGHTCIDSLEIGSFEPVGPRRGA